MDQSVSNVYCHHMNVLFRVLFVLTILAATRVVTHRAPVAGAAASLQVLATVGGRPDDITVDSRHRLVWGDLAAGTLNRLDHGHGVVIARGLFLPEGIVALRNGEFIVAEQGFDRIDRIGPRGKQTVLHRLQPVPGQQGVDGIGLDLHSNTLLIPDSPRGTVLRMSLDGRHVRLIARGLGRPVDAAADAHGSVLLPDEHLGTLVVVSRKRHVTYHGTLSTPDDVAVDRFDRIWLTTLGDGGLWEIAPGHAPRRVLKGLANPQGLTLDACGDPIVVIQNTTRIVRLLLTSASRRCAL